MFRTPIRNCTDVATFPIKDLSARQNIQEPSSPKMLKSSSIVRPHGFCEFQQSDSTFNSQETPVQNSHSDAMVENSVSLGISERIPSIKRQDSFEMRLPDLPKIDVHQARQPATKGTDPESPISPLLTSDLDNERSHSKAFCRSLEHFDEVPIKQKGSMDLQTQKTPSLWRLFELSLAEWLYALLGSTGAAIFGSFNPLFAYILALIIAAYYSAKGTELQHEVNKWCLVIACMGLVTVIANFLQHFYFGIMGEKMTERVRRMMFSGKCCTL